MKIHFYSAEFRMGEGPQRVDVADPRSLFRHITGLHFRGVPPGNTNSRYMEILNRNYIAMVTAQEVSVGSRGILGTVRRNDLPDVESRGRLEGLNLPANAGLFEDTHFVLFHPQMILGMEFNFFGPRTGRLSEYLLGKCQGLVDEVEFTPILRQDVRERLREIGEVSLVEIAIRRDEIALTGRLHASLRSAFDAAREVAGDGDFEILEIALKKQPYRRVGRSRLPFGRDDVEGLLTDPRGREALAKFNVRARNTRTNAMETFDLLEDKMISVARVVTAGGRRRSVDSDSMFTAIEEAFRVHRDELAILRGHR
jgi:hypothetical protein